MTTVYLSTLLKHPVRDRAGRELGRLSDVIVTLPADSYPSVTGLLLTPGDRDVFIAADRIAGIADGSITLGSATVDLRPFTRRDGEVLLRADVLGHRLLDADRARLIRAYDLVLTETQPPAGWQVTGVDLHRSSLWQRITDHPEHQVRDWAEFVALIGHQPTTGHRRLLARLRGLKAAQIADLLEAATAAEQHEILQHVHADPELEADVFEELDDDRQTRLLAARTDTEIAAVLARMNADDAADALMELPQQRRRPVLNALPQAQRRQLTTLLGYAGQTAGGLMSLDHLALPADTTVAAALGAVADARDRQPQALTSVYLVDEPGCLLGVAILVALVQADPDALLGQLADTDPIKVLPDTDPVEITRLMADHNLLLLPVVDPDNHLLGAITVDDALEAAIPDNWRHRQADTPLAPEPETRRTDSSDKEA